MELKRLARLLMAGTAISVATWEACAAPAALTVMLTAPRPPDERANQTFPASPFHRTTPSQL